MQSILIFVLSTSKILNLPFEHCIKNCKKHKGAARLLFYTRKYMVVLKKVNKKFTNWRPVLTVKKMMLTKSKMRFS